MNHPVQQQAAATLALGTVRTIRPARGWEAALGAAVDGVKRMRSTWKRHRQIMEACDALRQLDAHTLKDLGFHRSEILSVAAEVAGTAEPTRLRMRA